jgi:hypothetical protein
MHDGKDGKLLRRDSNLMKRELPMNRKTSRIFEHVALYSGVPVTRRSGFRRSGFGNNINLGCGGGAL